MCMDKPKDSSDANRPAALGGAPVFVQTVQTPEFPKLDNWKQMTEEEARAAYDMALCNELSGGTLCGDYPGYKEGDFPVSEKMLETLVFLPVLSDPVPDAAERMLEAIRKVADHAHKLVNAS